MFRFPIPAGLTSVFTPALTCILVSVLVLCGILAFLPSAEYCSEPSILSAKPEQTENSAKSPCNRQISHPTHSTSSANTMGMEDSAETTKKMMKTRKTFEITYLRGEVAGDQWNVETTTGNRVWTVSEAELRLRRAGQMLTQRIGYETLCDTGGGLIRAVSRLPGGVRIEIEVRDGGNDDSGNPERVAVFTDSSGQHRTIPFPVGTGGFTELARNLRERPMQPGEMRSFRALEFGGSEIPEKTTLSAIDHEPTTFPAEISAEPVRTLLRIERTTTGGAMPQQWTLWCDEHGEILKQTTSLLGLETYQANATTARRLSGRVAEFDAMIVVPVHDETVNHVFPTIDLQRLTRLRCRITLRPATDDTSFSKANLATFFPETRLQRILLAGDRSLDVELRSDSVGGDNAIGDETKNASPLASDAPTDADRAPNAWIESNASELVAVAESVLPEERDATKIAVALEQETRCRIRQPNYESGFESALSALRSGTGDCTEHAVLLAALARARGIPSRVATGLILTHDSAEFHAWTEIWIGDRWLSLDATRPDGGISARYLRATADHLGGIGAVARLQKLLPIVGNLEITITEAEYQNGS